MYFLAMFIYGTGGLGPMTHFVWLRHCAIYIPHRHTTYDTSCHIWSLAVPYDHN